MCLQSKHDNKEGADFLCKQNIVNEMHRMFETLTWNAVVALLPSMRIDKIRSVCGGDLRFDLINGGGFCRA